MNLLQHPDDYIQSFNDAVERREQRARLLRALRGAVPPFSGETERKLTASMRRSAHGNLLMGERR